LVVAPLVLDHDFVWAGAHSVAMGIAAFGLSLNRGRSRHQQGGGWRGLYLK
jgi:hypothetical protein